MPFIENSGSSILPTFAFQSEQSLGWYRSGASTLGLSYGTLQISALSTNTLSIGSSSPLKPFHMWGGPSAGSLIARIEHTQGSAGQAGLHLIGGGSGSRLWSILQADSGYSGSQYSNAGGTAGLSIEAPAVNKQWAFTGAGQFLVSDGAGGVLAPGIAFGSEFSLGFTRSGVSTIALSYGTFNLNQARLTSIKTNASNSGLNAILGANEWAIGVGVSNATLMFRSGNTTYLWGTSSTTSS